MGQQELRNHKFHQGVLVRVLSASHSIATRSSRLIAKVDDILCWFAVSDDKAKKKTKSPLL